MHLTLLNKINKYLLPKHSAASNNNKISNICDVITVKLDSGATCHYFKEEHKYILTHLKQLQNGPVAQLPDNSFVKATHEGILNIHPGLSDEVKKVLIYPQVTNKSLLSVSQLTNDYCKVFFDDTKAIIMKANKLILTGTKNPNDNLYDISLPSQRTNKINFIMRKDKTKTDLTKFYHATLFSPLISTLNKAIRYSNFYPGQA